MAARALIGAVSATRSGAPMSFTASEMRLLYVCDDAPLALEHALALARMAQHGGHAARLLVLTTAGAGHAGPVERTVDGVATRWVPAAGGMSVAAEPAPDLVHVLAGPEHWPDGLAAAVDALARPLVIGLEAALPSAWPAHTACVVVPHLALVRAARAALPATVAVHHVAAGVDVLAVLAARPAARGPGSGLTVGVPGGPADLTAARMSLQALAPEAEAAVRWAAVPLADAAARRRSWWAIDLVWCPDGGAAQRHASWLQVEAAAAGVPAVPMRAPGLALPARPAGATGNDVATISADVGVAWLARWPLAAELRRSWHAALRPPPRIEEQAFFCESLYRAVLGAR